jgi:hypothetical protein
MPPEIFKEETEENQKTSENGIESEHKEKQLVKV